jgi:hypothetical protein
MVSETKLLTPINDIVPKNIDNGEAIKRVVTLWEFIKTEIGMFKKNERDGGK